MTDAPVEENSREKINGPATFLGIPLRSWSSVDSDRRVTVIRIAAGVVLMGLGFLLFGIGASRGITGLFHMLAGMVILVLAAALFGTVVSRKGAMAVSNLIYTDKHFDKPQPLYSRSESLVMQGRFEEAVEGFLKITEEYPEEVTAWMHLLDIAFLKLKDPERARDFFTKGLSMMKDNASRIKLGRLYRSHLECLGTRELLDSHESASHGAAPCEGYGEIDPDEEPTDPGS